MQKVRNIHLIPIFLFGELLSSCGLNKPLSSSQSKTIVAPVLVEEKLKLIDELFTKDALCEDYRLAQLLMAYVHNEPKGYKIQTECPNNFESFTKHLSDALGSLDDLHVDMKVGMGLDATSYPVIEKCEGHPLCPDLLGSAIYGIRSPTDAKIYAMAYDKLIRAVPLSLTRINGFAPAFYKEKLLQNSLFSHNQSGAASVLADFVLQRGSLDLRDKSDLIIEALDFQSQVPLRIRASYIAVQNIFPPVDIQGRLQQLEVSRAYHCRDIFPKSEAAIGACITDERRAVFWLQTWPQHDEDTFKNYLRDLFSWFSSRLGEGPSILLDLRANTGGSPISVAHMLCMIGGPKTFPAIEKMQLESRVWPGIFNLGSKQVKAEDLIVINNKGLQIVDPALAVDMDGRVPFRSQSSSSAARAQLTQEVCDQLQMQELRESNWTLLTNGREFSATEEFLYLAKNTVEHIKHIGAPSAGGAGNPSWIFLPNTSTKIRISPTRYSIDGKIIIEKEGVWPDELESVWESSEEFEARILRVIDSGKVYDPEDKEVPYKISRYLSPLQQQF